MKNRVERGLRILLLLQSGDSYGAIQLADSLSVSRRTIFRDIALLRDLGLPIEFDVETNAYHVHAADGVGGSAQSEPPAASQLDRPVKALDSERLTHALRQAFIQDDVTKSDTNIIRQVALSLAEPSAGYDTATSRRLIQRIDSSHELSETVDGGRSIQAFAETLDLIQFLCEAITKSQTLEIHRSKVDSSEASTLSIVPTEIRFAGPSWQLLARMPGGESIELSVGDFYIFSDQQENSNVKSSAGNLLLER